MYTVNADWTGALYGYNEVTGKQDKLTLVGLTEVQIAASIREKNRVDQLGFNPTNDPEQSGLSTIELSAMLTGLAAQEPNFKMGIFSQAQLKWAHANHPDFKPKQTEEA